MRFLTKSLQRSPQWARGLLDAAVRLLAPPHCMLCKRLDYQGPDPWLCPQCDAGLPRLSAPLCEICGAPQAAALTSPQACMACAGIAPHPPLLQVRSVVWMEGGAQELLHAAKFAGKRPLIRSWVRLSLANPWLLQWLQGVGGIVAVPAHHKRLRQRGFNQSLVYARGLARTLNLPLYAQALRKARDTPPQSSGLNRPARQRNLQDAFVAHRLPVSLPPRLLLVDDVLTTGATLSACAAALLQAAPQLRIDALSFARTPPGRPTTHQA